MGPTLPALYRSDTKSIYFTDDNLVHYVLSYGEDGYCVIREGDILDGRYLSLFVLGYGGDGQVWLCRDIHKRYETTLLDRSLPYNLHSSSDSATSYVAIKVVRPREPATDHLHVEGLLSHLPRSMFHISGMDRITQIQRTFDLVARDKTHRCFVMEALGPSLSEYIQSQDYQLGDAPSIAFDCFCAVGALHTLGICHGDIDISNFAVEPPSWESRQLSDEYIYERFGYPQMRKKRVIPEKGKALPPGVPLWIYPPASLKIYNGDTPVMDPPMVKLLDFGSASFVNQQAHKTKYHTRAAAPETLQTQETTCKTDMWSLGVILCFLLTRDYIMDIFSKTKRLDRHGAMLGRTGMEHFLSLTTVERKQAVSERLLELYPGMEGYVFAATDLLIQLLQPEPFLRPEAYTVVNGHPFFQPPHMMGVSDTAILSQSPPLVSTQQQFSCPLERDLLPQDEPQSAETRATRRLTM